MNPCESLISSNPYDGEVLAIIPFDRAAEVDEKLERCHKGREAWRADLERRLAALDTLAELAGDRTEELARLAAVEMGKPIREGRAEVEKCITLCRYYLRHGSEHLAARTIDSAGASAARSLPRPLGTILGVMPWNYPFWQAFRFLVPTLLAGNAALLKHASNVPQCALALDELMRDAGFGEDCYATVIAAHRTVMDLIADDRVDGVSLTGSERAGRKIAAAAGESLKPCLLELGGCDPFIVLEDADCDEAAATAVRARFQNAGQSCIAAKRFLIHEDHLDGFTEAFVARTRELVLGDPREETTEIGPLAKSKSVDDLTDAVRDATDRGARLLLEGGAVGPGNVVMPVILAEVDSDMIVAGEEIFGPLAVIRGVASAEEALRIANETRYGLGASLWTSSEERAFDLAGRLESGMVFVNDMVVSAPELPFGGTKRSGFGRELGREGLLAFTNLQTTCVATGRIAGKGGAR